MKIVRKRQLLFASIFALVMAEGLFIQLILLPYILPSLHAGDGLLKGLDSVGFLETARMLAMRIGEEGWSAWVFRVDTLNTPPSLAAIIYALTTPQPFVLLPINALLWALTALIWFEILRRLFPSLGASAAFGALLVVLMPSAMTWTTQFLKDIFSIPGISLLLLAIVRALTFRRIAETDPAEAGNAWIELTLDLFLVVAAAAMIWVVRPYLLQLPAAGALLLVPVLVVLTALHRMPRLNLALGVVVIAGLVACSFVGNRYYSSAAGTYHDASQRILNQPSSHAALSGKSSISTFGMLDKAAHMLGDVRTGYCGGVYDGAGSSIDCDVRIRDFLDLLAYSPRMAQIAFLAPFPRDWLADGKTPGGGLMRLLAGAEMSLIYGVLFAGLGALVIGRAQLSGPIFAALIYLTLPMMIIVVSTPNLGTVHRMRYVFLVGIAAIALSLVSSPHVRYQ
jgi:hypothetical protein